MISLIISLVWLTCASIDSNKGTFVFKKDCHRKTCLDLEYDPREAVCCEDCLHSGPGLLCCGNLPFNPAEATCCKVEQGNKETAHITRGLSQSVSSCCGLKSYDSLNEICCQSTISDKPAANAQCCGKDAYDEDKQLCCFPHGKGIILQKKSSNHVCCGDSQYDKQGECCCLVNDAFKIEPSGSSCCMQTSDQTVPTLCGEKSYNTLNELCCGLRVVNKMTPGTRCCGNGTFDISTECCCWVDDSFLKHPVNAKCCKEQGLVPENQRTQLDRTEAHAAQNGSSCFNMTDDVSCKRRQMELPLSTADPGNAAPSVAGPDTHVPCAEWKPSYQCCGRSAFSLAQHSGRSQTAFADRENAERCSDVSGPVQPAEGTTCCSRFHASPGQHCCGTEVYQPHEEICCSGRRHRRQDNWHCCGVHSYNIKNRRLKCCGGTVYTLTSGRSFDAQCCGSVLLKPSDVCCSSEHKEVLYSAKEGFKCCGHLYYDTSLWSCCAETINGQKQGQHERKLIKGSSFVPLVNLNGSDLCREIKVGIVDSVSLHSIVFSSVLIIFGRNATVRPLPSTHIMNTPDHCSAPKLIPGQTYFFNHAGLFTDFYHDSLLKSLHLIFSVCHHS